MVYRLYWIEDGKNCEMEFNTRTEAEIHKAVLKRRGILARMIALKITVDDSGG